MSRPRQRPHSGSLSQRQSQIGGRLCVIAVAHATLLWPAVASAEVCDKVNGINVMFSQTVPGPLEMMVGEIVIAASFVALVVAGRMRWLGVIAAVVAAAYAALIAVYFLEQDIYSAALREGCRTYSLDLFRIGAMTVFAGAFLWLGLRMRGGDAEAI